MSSSAGAIAQAGVLLKLFLGPATLGLDPSGDPAYKAAWRPEPAIASAPASDQDLIWRQESPNGFFFLVSAWVRPKPTPLQPYPGRHSVIAIWPKGHRLRPAEIVGSGALVVLDQMELDKALWADNSRFVAFTARHVDGLDAWNHPAFLLDVATRRLYPVQPISGPVVGGDLAWADNGALRLWVGLRDAQGALDLGERIQADVPLAKVLAQEPVGTAPPWVSAYALEPEEGPAGAVTAPEARALSGALAASAAAAVPMHWTSPDGVHVQATVRSSGLSPDAQWQAVSFEFQAQVPAKAGGVSAGVASGIALFRAGEAIDPQRAWAMVEARDLAAERFVWSEDGRYCVALARNGAGHQPYALSFLVLSPWTPDAKVFDPGFIRPDFEVRRGELHYQAVSGWFAACTETGRPQHRRLAELLPLPSDPAAH